MKAALVLFLVAAAPFLARANPVPLESDKTVLQDGDAQLKHVDVERDQFLVSFKAGKQIKKIQIWSKASDGGLDKIAKTQTSSGATVLQLSGGDGDYNFFEFVAWKPKTGELVRLIDGSGFDVPWTVKNAADLEIRPKQIAEAPDLGDFSTTLTRFDAACGKVMQAIRLLEKKKDLILKRSGAVPSEPDLKSLSELGKKREKLNPRQWNFDLKNLADVGVSCR